MTDQPPNLTPSATKPKRGPLDELAHLGGSIGAWAGTFVGSLIGSLVGLTVGLLIGAVSGAISGGISGAIWGAQLHRGGQRNTEGTAPPVAEGSAILQPPANRVDGLSPKAPAAV